MDSLFSTSTRLFAGAHHFHYARTYAGVGVGVVVAVLSFTFMMSYTPRTLPPRLPVGWFVMKLKDNRPFVDATAKQVHGLMNLAHSCSGPMLFAGIQVTQATGVSAKR